MRFDYATLLADLEQVGMYRWSGAPGWQELHSHNKFDRGRFSVFLSNRGELTIEPMSDANGAVIDFADQKTVAIFAVIMRHLTLPILPNAEESSE